MDTPAVWPTGRTRGLYPRRFQYASDKEALSHLVLLDLLVEQLFAAAARLGQPLP